uniref:Glycerol-3-phosphate acyltransferase 2, mitochondrial n=1 Tax=Neogobius melanostomus TaxID=47308 RepID=A0A8C6TCG6_9GOBI
NSPFCVSPKSVRRDAIQLESLSWDLKIKRKMKVVPPCLGLFRPTVGQCCHQCTPDSLRKKFEQNSLSGFRNILNINEKHTRYRGWLVRRMCCILFVSGCKVFPSLATNRVERVCQSNRYPSLYYLLLFRFVGWLFLKMFAAVFGNIQVNLNHLLTLHKASQDGPPLVYVYMHQSDMDCALIPLALFCHSLRVPYTLCPFKINNRLLRTILQKIGVVCLLNAGQTEQEIEKDGLYAAVVTSLVRELLHEGQAISVAVSAESGQGGQWLACIRQLIKEGAVPDVSLVPVGISYNCVPPAKPQVMEMCESGRCRVDDWLPLQDLLQPVILNYRLILALSPSLQGVKLSVLCRDVSWLTEELLFRNKDVGFGGSLPRVVHYSLSLLAPHLIIAAAPSRKDPMIVPRPSPAATNHLTLQAQTVTHAFILEAVGACAVSAMLSDVAGSGVSSRVRSNGVDGEAVKGDMEFDVALCQTELTDRALKLCHLLPPGFTPPCQSSHSFALDAVDSLVRCGILIMEEVPRDAPICDVWKRDGTFSWTTSDDPYNSDSDCEELEPRSFKITQPNQCPEMLFFLCSMLSGFLRSLCWATSALENLLSPLPVLHIRRRSLAHCSSET